MTTPQANNEALAQSRAEGATSNERLAVTKAMYVLTRCKTKIGNDRHKMTHFGTDHKTLCGKVIDEMWWIEASFMSVTCPKCKAKMVTAN